MSENQNINRRGFLQLSGALLLAPVVIGAAAKAEERRRGSAPAAAAGGAKELDLPLVEPGKDAALAMRYYHSHADAKADAQVNKAEKTGVPWEKQLCSSCSFYKKAGTKKVAGKDQEVGTCTIFPQKLVAGAGFCNSWAKKA